ncbi:catalase family peroxidase [Nocardia callitridis]|uniref:catalase family peroxidase n=1 Tax=Nocardia callitridis TaxID=648753 RepID=UPI0031EDFBAA
MEGYFESNGTGTELSRASVFEPGRYPVRGRFSLSGGNPHVADDSSVVRGLALRIDLPNSEQWRLATINLPVFLDPTPQDFYDRMLAFAADPATGKPDADRKSHYLATHPRTAAAMAITKTEPVAPTFASSTFRGLNAFEFTDTTGRTIPVRWTLIPETTATPAPGRGPDYLFDQLKMDIRAAPCRWALTIVVGVPGTDRTDDATVAWPDSRRTVTVGTLVLTGIATATADSVRETNFDPLVLPDGIAPSDDPLLAARSAAYAESFRRRSGEGDGRGAIEAGGAA